VAFEIAFAAVTLYTARPAFASLHLPLQDLPQHMAAISVLERLAVDSGLRQYFELTLSRTQYLLVYALGVPLSIPFGVEYATRLLVALTVISLPYALRFAMRRTGGDERLAALAWPFAWNPQMMLGFLNYLLGVPIALVGLGLFADRAKRATRARQIQLALIALAAFYSHLIPYGLLGLGVLLMLDGGDDFDPVRAPWRQTERPTGARLAASVRALGPALRRALGRWVGELVFLAPSLLAVAVWILRSPARDPSVRAGGVAREVVLVWPDTTQLPAQFRDTILNVGGPSDERALIAWGLALMAALALSRALADDTREAGGWRGRVAWLPFACALLYVCTPESYGWIWPIHTRFALAAVLLLPLAFPRSRARVLPLAIMAAMAWCAVTIANDLTAAFKRWDQEELGDLDAALARARPGRRLVALVPAVRSAFIPSNVPLLHAAAYYQVRGGHVATFSFADFPQSPFRYREDGPRPPRLRPRWEWETSLREADPRLDYYDYVLARAGYTDEAAHMPELYQRIYEGSEWNLYERRR
jgi:hypothetical protein